MEMARFKQKDSPEKRNAQKHYENAMRQYRETGKDVFLRFAMKIKQENNLE